MSWVLHFLILQHKADQKYLSPPATGVQFTYAIKQINRDTTNITGDGNKLRTYAKLKKTSMP